MSDEVQTTSNGKNLKETETELYNLAEKELRENEDLLYFAVNVKLRNVSVYDADQMRQDMIENRQMIEASRSLVDHVNNMYEQLKSIMSQVENKISESYNMMERAERMKEEAQEKIEQKWYESMPLAYKLGAGAVMVAGWFSGFLF